MTNEEKAKAYDEVLKRVRPLYEQAIKDGNPIWSTYEYLIPSLCESEDERIRKKLLSIVKWSSCFWASGITKEDVDEVTTYLEKQKENVEKEYVFRPLAGTDITIAAEQAIRRAMEGDHIVLAFNGWYVPVDKHATVKGLVDSYNTFIEKQKEQKHYWKPTETDVLLLDKAVITNKALTPTERAHLDIIRAKLSLCHAINCSGIVQKEQKLELYYDKELDSAARDFYFSGSADSLVDSTGLVPIVRMAEFGATWMKKKMEKEQKPAGWSEEDKEMLRIVSNRLDKFSEWATEKGYPIDDPTMKQSPIAWFKDLPERFNLQPKQEWSEEDENMFDDILLDMADRREMFKSEGETTFAEDTQKKIDWLSSHHLQLKYQFSCPQPKQEWSEEDELMLTAVIQTLERFCGRGTTGMQIDWLKSLRPQSDKCNECAKNLEGYISGRTDAENELLDRFGAVITPEGELNMKPRWKPSNVQMDALLWCSTHISGADKQTLDELYEHLKKL